MIAVIGGGPAGLRAAEVAAAAGVRVTLFDAKPSVGRKFLVAGKGGLNLTHGEPFESFVGRYRGPACPPAMWRGLLVDFGPEGLRQWAAGLGVETFEASSGRVYPKRMKAASLLRAWVARLKSLGVKFEMRHPWCGLAPGVPLRLSFTNGVSVEADAVVLALGGGSWPQTGSTGGWLPVLRSLGVPCAPLSPSNCGWECEWPPGMLDKCEGMPLKNIHVSAGNSKAAGELLVTRYGLEGGAIYQLGPALREMPAPAIAIDFKPTFTEAELVAKMESVKRDPLAAARVRWKLSEAAHAMLSLRDCPDVAALAREVKHCVIPLIRARPLAEAISSTGGVEWSALDASLMLRDLPGVFVAGEMIDWDAPTGGYLMQGCFATGTRAGSGAAVWVLNSTGFAEGVGRRRSEPHLA
jgi:uncharacterized flavoprotein (TIGR03862 family)